jgi:peptidoglycan-associated lipoprotein
LQVVQGRVFSGIAVMAAAGVLSACATKPKPVVAPPAPPRASPPAPRPAPSPPPAPASTAPLPGSERDFVINVGDHVYFDYDKFQIRSDAEPILAAQAGWLVRYPSVQVRVEGNCDDRGTEDYNLALGARRANAVKMFLVNHGVGTQRIATVSYGKERPIDMGTGEQAWAHNRNVHTAILSGAR